MWLLTDGEIERVVDGYARPNARGRAGHAIARAQLRKAADMLTAKTQPIQSSRGIAYLSFTFEDWEALCQEAERKEE